MSGILASVTKIMTMSPKQSHTKDIISKDNNNPFFDENKKSKEKIDFELIMDAYNDAVDDKLPKVKIMTEGRKKSVQKLLKQLENPTFQSLADYFYGFVDNAKSFYFGDNDRNWKADFDFVVRPSTYIKFLEGSL